MDQNFENNVNNAENNTSAPVTPNGNYTQPMGSQYNTYYSGGQYMPYGSYQRPVVKPEAPKKASKGKKTGLIIAAVAIGLCFVLSLGIIKGTTITLIADGPDENEAIEGLVELIEKELVNC